MVNEGEKIRGKSTIKRKSMLVFNEIHLKYVSIDIINYVTEREMC